MQCGDWRKCRWHVFLKFSFDNQFLNIFLWLLSGTKNNNVFILVVFRWYWTSKWEVLTLSSCCQLCDFSSVAMEISVNFGNDLFFPRTLPSESQCHFRQKPFFTSLCAKFQKRTIVARQKVSRSKWPTSVFSCRSASRVRHRNPLKYLFINQIKQLWFFPRRH